MPWREKLYLYGLFTLRKSSCHCLGINLWVAHALRSSQSMEDLDNESRRLFVNTSNRHPPNTVASSNAEGLWLSILTICAYLHLFFKYKLDIPSLPLIWSFPRSIIDSLWTRAEQHSYKISITEFYYIGETSGRMMKVVGRIRRRSCSWWLWW